MKVTNTPLTLVQKMTGYLLAKKQVSNLLTHSRNGLLAIGLLLLSGCVSLQQADNRIMAWQTSDLSTILESWGIPDREQTVGQRKFYIWNDQQDSSNPAIGISLGTGGRHGGISLGTLIGGNREQNFCSRIVEVDAQEQLVGIQWQGEPEVCFKATPVLERAQ